MELLRSVLVLLLSVSAGVLLVAYLAVHTLQMGWALLGSWPSGFSVVVLLATGFSGVQLLLSGFLSILCALAGYAGMARVVLSRQDTRALPALRRVREDRGMGHTAVIYFTHGEPETYDPIGWINQFREFDEQGIRFVPFPVRP